MVIPKNLDNAIFEISKFPGIGRKSAFRIALYLQRNTQFVDSIATSISLLKDISLCSKCNALIDKGNICPICSDESRSNSLLVLEDFQDVVAFESSRSHNGYYFILGGLISPMRGIMPENLNLNSFIERIKELSSNGKLEIIFGLNSVLDGDSTFEYLKREILEIFGHSNISISKLALGIPKGADIDYLDEETLKMSLVSRVNEN